MDLLFTKAVRPGKLKSPELALRAKQKLPLLQVLYTSGYTQNAIVHAGRLDEGVELIAKPFTRERLAHKIRAVLELRRSFLHAPVGPAHKSSGTPKQSQHANPPVYSILIVEDEVLIRITLREILEDLCR